MQQEIDALVDAIKREVCPSWVAVGTGLPDEEQTVLIALDDGDVWTGFLESGKWHFVSGDRVADTVTHWMDFPEPPVIEAEHHAQHP